MSTLFTIFGIPVRSYGLMLAIGFLLAFWRLKKICRKKGLCEDYLYDISLLALVCGVFGSRALYVFLNLDTESFSSFFRIWQGGLSFHGGLVLSLVCGYIYSRIKGINMLEYTDICMPSVAIGYGVGRIGCYLNGCCGSDLYPVQLISSAASFLIFFILTRLEKLTYKPGFILASYAVLYGLYRFLIEFLRVGYSAQPWRFGLTQAQGISAVMFVAGVVFAFVLRKRGGVE